MKKQNIKESLDKLEKISSWFEEQKDIDVEAGLEKVKTAAVLIKDLKSRLKDVENEFEEVKKELGDRS
ncbi:MAG: hypothetical protein WC764_00660 [Candidatus Paceibacterota bacterium]|jgi:pyruvate formate-lyase activating enzyme-like uncharacterized protein